MVMNIPNVEIYLSNNYQTDNNYSISRAKKNSTNSPPVIDFLMFLHLTWMFSFYFAKYIFCEKND